MISISACQDNEVTSDGHSSTTGNGFFTTVLLNIWNDKEFTNYPEFHNKIKAKVTSINKNQHPNYDPHNAEKFERQFPFTIDAPANGFLFRLWNFLVFRDRN